MSKLEIYAKDWCPFCAKAKALLTAKNLDFEEIDVTADTVREREMIARAGRRTVPQIFIAGQPIGGFDDLAYLNATGELDRLLADAEQDLAQAGDGVRAVSRNGAGGQR